MDMADIQEALTKHLPTIRKCMHRAHEQYRRSLAETPELCVAYDVRIAAICTNSLIWQSIREYFQDVAGVSISETLKFLVLVFDGGFNLRFKKLDLNRLANHNRTVQSTKLACQEPLLPFSEDLGFDEVMPNDGPMLVAGYQLDPSGTKIIDTLITSPVGRSRNAWSFSIDEMLDIREELQGTYLPIVDPSGTSTVIKAKATLKTAKQA